jgi:tRNA-modifying protein YgfZ
MTIREYSANEDYTAARAGLALFDLSGHGLVSCTGKDASRFLHNLCTNDVEKLAPGNACEAFFTSAQAKIVGHAWILRREDKEPALLVDVGPNDGPRILSHLDRFLISEQLELRDETSSFSRHHLAGPTSGQVLSKALSVDATQLRDLESRPFEFGGMPARIWRRNRVGVIGYDVLTGQDQADRFKQSLRDSGCILASPEAYDVLRIEAGLPRYGIDITEANLPQEVGRIEQTISFTKGCYIGQETIARIRSYGHVNRMLSGIVLGGEAPVTPATRLFHNEAEAGVVTSCVRSPQLGCPIALGYLRRGSEALGTKIRVGSPDGGLNCQVHALPFVPFTSNA